MNSAPKLLPGRQYKRVGRTIRRIPIPMKPPIPCVIVGNSKVAIAYDFETKNIVHDDSRSGTLFSSRTKARKALWHIIQNEKNLSRGPYTIIDQISLQGR